MTLFRLTAFCLALMLPFPASATIVRMLTVYGVVDVALYDGAAPRTVANFLSYVRSGAYDGSFIHRAVPGFVVQGGGYVWTAQGLGQINTLPPVVNEFSPERSNVRGTIAMAKVEGNPDSATSQWFFNLADNSLNLDRQNGGFTVFGRVIGAGMSVVDAMVGKQVVQAAPFNQLPIVKAPNGTSIDGSFLVKIESVKVLPTGALVAGADRVFNHLEAAFPQYVAPASRSTQGLGEFRFRYYPGTGALLITDGNMLWYLGAASGGLLHELGRLDAWLVKAEAAGY